ncbi:MAG TPA: RraA family protein [Methylomirabilota bacterium]|nr:RraA family protein [Methylomirabilota bacterium]
MPDTPLPDDVLKALGQLDTPTICNALELVAPQRRGFGYTTRPFVCARLQLPPIVGYARTATIRAMHPSERSAAELREQRLAYYRYVSEGPRPSIMVIEDLDPLPGYGAWWGEVNTNLHKGLGCLGVVTSGCIRDLPLCAEGFQLLAGSVNPSHAYVHLESIEKPVTVHGMTVQPGDLLHADQHGAVVVPVAVARQIPEAAAQIGRREQHLIAASRRPDFDFAMLARAIREADEIH